MPEEIRGTPDIRGNAINLFLTEILGSFASTGFGYGVKVVRRERAYPVDSDDGVVVVDVPNLIEGIGDGAPLVQRTVFCLSQLVNGQLPDQIDQVTLDRYYESISFPQPIRVQLSYSDESSVQKVIEGVTRVEQGPKRVSDHRVEETISVYYKDNQSTAVEQFEIETNYRADDAGNPGRFTWLNSPASIRKKWSTKTDIKGFLDENTGDYRFDIAILDVGLIAGVTFYYGVFIGPRSRRISATPTGHHQLDDRLYRLLPATHQQHDEPTRDKRGKGQLRRYLQCMGLGFDLLRSRAEELRKRHDVREVQADCLPSLAHWIGWDLNYTLDEIAQRTEILFAPEIYRSVGTIANIKAFVNHSTGWNSRIKEYVHNIACSNCPESIHLWELFEGIYDPNKEKWDVKPVTSEEPLPEQFEGRPAVVTVDGVLHLFYHVKRDNRWEIWYRTEEVVVDDSGKVKVKCSDSDGIKVNVGNASGVQAAGLEPAVVADPNTLIGAGYRLFWSDFRDGQWNIWERSVNEESKQVTHHIASDRHPSAVLDQKNGNTWLFFQSDRSGSNDIWSMMWLRDEETWKAPQRLTTGEGQNFSPTSCLDDQGRIWLFWSNEVNGRSRLFTQVYEVKTKTDPLKPLLTQPQAITDGQHRDESPTALFWDKGESPAIWLFWHSNRDGSWQIWRQALKYTDNNGTAVVDKVVPSDCLTSCPTADKEPAVVVDSFGRLRLFWRSQRRGYIYQSRTFRVEDKNTLQTFDDRLHYTFETGKNEEHRYTPDTIGIYLQPDTEDAELEARNRRIVSSTLKRFLPARVRALPNIEPAVYHEAAYTEDGVPRDRYRDEVEPILENRTLSKLTVSRDVDTITGWFWVYSWGTDHQETNVSNNPAFRTWHTWVELAQDQPAPEET